MSYRVELSRRAERDLSGLLRAVADRVRLRIFTLADDPRPRGSAKIASPDRWRLRVGDYRAIYDIDDRAQLVIVQRVGHRKDVYR